MKMYSICTLTKQLLVAFPPFLVHVGGERKRSQDGHAPGQLRALPLVAYALFET